MAVTRLSDVVIPEEFTTYVTQNSMETSALVQSRIALRNGVIEDQLRAGADSFTVPFWNDLPDEEANITNDDPADEAVPAKLTSEKQIVRKAFLHKSWSAMNLASELAGADAIARIQDRASAYWTRQLQRRLISSLIGVLDDNIANAGGDMVLDLTAEVGAAAQFSAEATIDAAGTMGDQMGGMAGIAMHSDIYRKALKTDLVEFVKDSAGSNFATFRGMAVVVDDLLPVDEAEGDYTSVLFAPGAVGWGMTSRASRKAPRSRTSRGLVTAAGSRSCIAARTSRSTHLVSNGVNRASLAKVRLLQSLPIRRTGPAWWTARLSASPF